MKKIMLVLLFLGMTPVLKAENKTGDFGVGAIFGDINGPTVKYFVGPNVAVDAGLGFSHNMEAYGDIVWHAWDLFPRPQMGQFGGYLGFGPRYQERDHDDDKFGVRGLAGVDYWTERYPLEFFVEFGPWFVFTPDTDTEMDLGLGIRYYFGTNGAGVHRR